MSDRHRRADVHAGTTDPHIARKNVRITGGKIVEMQSVSRSAGPRSD